MLTRRPPRRYTKAQAAAVRKADARVREIERLRKPAIARARGVAGFARNVRIKVKPGDPVSSDINVPLRRATAELAEKVTPDGQPAFVGHWLDKNFRHLTSQRDVGSILRDRGLTFADDDTIRAMDPESAQMQDRLYRELMHEGSNRVQLVQELRSNPAALAALKSLVGTVDLATGQRQRLALAPNLSRDPESGFQPYLVDPNNPNSGLYLPAYARDLDRADLNNQLVVVGRRGEALPRLEAIRDRDLSQDEIQDMQDLGIEGDIKAALGRMFEDALTGYYPEVVQNLRAGVARNYFDAVADNPNTLPAIGGRYVGVPYTPVSSTTPADLKRLLAPGVREDNSYVLGSTSNDENLDYGIVQIPTEAGLKDAIVPPKLVATSIPRLNKKDGTVSMVTVRKGTSNVPGMSDDTSRWGIWMSEDERAAASRNAERDPLTGYTRVSTAAPVGNLNGGRPVQVSDPYFRMVRNPGDRADITNVRVPTFKTAKTVFAPAAVRDDADADIQTLVFKDEPDPDIALTQRY